MDVPSIVRCNPKRKTLRLPTSVAEEAPSTQAFIRQALRQPIIALSRWLSRKLPVAGKAIVLASDVQRLALFPKGAHHCPAFRPKKKDYEEETCGARGHPRPGGIVFHLCRKMGLILMVR